MLPILDKNVYNRYHLYSIPTSYSTTIIPPTKCASVTEYGTYYIKDKCRFLQREFFCSLSKIEKDYTKEDCIRNLLRVEKNPNCIEIRVNVTQTLVETVNDEFCI